MIDPTLVTAAPNPPVVETPSTLQDEWFLQMVNRQLAKVYEGS